MRFCAALVFYMSFFVGHVHPNRVPSAFTLSFACSCARFDSPDGASSHAPVARQVPNIETRSQWVSAIQKSAADHSAAAHAASGSTAARNDFGPPPVPTSARPSGMSQSMRTSSGGARPLPEIPPARMGSGGGAASTLPPARSMGGGSQGGSSAWRAPPPDARVSVVLRSFRCQCSSCVGRVYLYISVQHTRFQI